MSTRPIAQIALAAVVVVGLAVAPAAVAADGTHDEQSDDDADEPFGQLVSALVQELQNETDGGVGAALADWVVANDPGNASDHAGVGGAPDAGNASPPAHAAADGGAAANATGADRGPDGTPDAADENATDAEEPFTPVDVGPPEHAGGDGDQRTDSDERNDGDQRAADDHWNDSVESPDGDYWSDSDEWADGDYWNESDEWIDEDDWNASDQTGGDAGPPEHAGGPDTAGQSAD